jgi:membrane fusion protein (multidrug efflux system)
MLQASNRLRRRAVAPLLSALVVALALAGCGGADAPAAGPGAGMPPAVVTTRTVEMQPWVDVIEALGTAQARESLTITAKVTETVDSVKFEDGDRVAAGDILVDLSGRAEVANLEEAQATFKEARQQYERLVGLVENGTVPRSQLDTQVAARDAARARVETIRARTTCPDRDFTGTVATVGSRVDPVTRAVTVRADFANPDGEIRPGMLMTVRVEKPTRQAVVIPELALLQIGGQSFVYAVGEGDAVQRVDVRSGARRAGEVEIVEGLAAGTRIVVEGTVKLRPGARIAEAPAAAVAAQAGGGL